MAVHAPITGARRRAPNSIPTLSRFDRQRIAAQIEALIDLLDASDGDCDLEDEDFDRCLAGDDGCGVFVDRWQGPLWGAAA